MGIKPRKLRDGTVVFDVRVQHRGAMVRRTVRGTLTQARRVEARIRTKLHDEDMQFFERKQDPTFKEYAKTYVQITSHAKSARRVRTHVNVFLPWFGKKRLSQITSIDVRSFLSARAGEVKPGTVNRDHAVLRRMFNVAIQDDSFKIRKNPLDGIRKEKPRSESDRELSVAEYLRLVECAPLYFARILIFAANTGMRKMEILGLKFHHVKFYRVGDEVKRCEAVLTDTKSGFEETVPLNRTAQALLFEMAEERSVDPFSPGEDQHVFLGHYGRPIKSVRKPMERTCKQAGLDVEFHALRHLWITEMLKKAPHDAVMKAGRIRDIKTLERYNHPDSSHLQDSVNQLEFQKPASVKKIQKHKTS